MEHNNDSSTNTDTILGERLASPSEVLVFWSEDERELATAGDLSASFSEITPGIDEALQHPLHQSIFVIEAEATRPDDQSTTEPQTNRRFTGVQLATNYNPKSLKPKWRVYTSYALASVVLLVTGYIGIDTWATNQTVKQQLEGSLLVGSVANAQGVPEDHDPDQEGKDQSQIGLETIANYKVADGVPRTVAIPAIGAYGRTLPMGVNRDNSLQAPVNINDAGWYTASSKPGELGAVVIDAHASSDNTTYGLFGKLKTIKKGDVVLLEVGGGKKYTYRVTNIEIVAYNKVDMNKLMLPFGDAVEGLNLITCTGSKTLDRSTLNNRLIVYTERFNQ